MAVGAGAGLQQRSMVVLRYVDVVLVAIVAVPALALGAPMLGYALGGGAWVLQRIIAMVDRYWTRKVAEPRTALAVNLFEAFGRIWLLAGAIVIAGVAGHRQDGLTASLVILGAYSAAFAIRVMSGPPQTTPGPVSRATPGTRATSGTSATPGAPARTGPAPPPGGRTR